MITATQITPAQFVVLVSLAVGIVNALLATRESARRFAQDGKRR